MVFAARGVRQDSESRRCGCQDSGILTFINILVNFCIYLYIVNHVIWITLFGIQKSLESSQESWNQAKNLGILPRFQKIPNHVEENS